METKEKLCMSIPKEATNCCNYRDACGNVIFRIVTMPDNTFIGQDKHSSLGFKSYEDAEQFLFTFNQ